MEKGKSTGLHIYEKHKVWEQAAIKEQEFEKKTEKEQVCLLLAIVEQIIRNKAY